MSMECTTVAALQARLTSDVTMNGGMPKSESVALFLFVSDTFNQDTRVDL